jgi:hypothetical protein
LENWEACSIPPKILFILADKMRLFRVLQTTWLPQNFRQDSMNEKRSLRRKCGSGPYLPMGARKQYNREQDINVFIHLV